MARADWIALGLALGLVGCGSDLGGDDADADTDVDTDSDSDGDPPECDFEGPEPVEGEVLSYLRTSGYQEEWAHEPAADGRRPNFRKSPHGNSLEIFVNTCVEATWRTGARRYPAGAMIILDAYAPKAKVPSVFVSYRINDDPAETAWWWVGFDETGVTIGEAGQDVGCDGCHSSGDDFVRAFTLDGA